MINARDTVTFSVGGQIFITRRSNLFRLPDSRLYMLAIQGNKNDDDDDTSLSKEKKSRTELDEFRKTPVYFFDRDPEIFRFVLDYYRTGELHLPSGICGPFVRKELIFWGVDESYILPCCMPAYMRYEEERRTKRTLFRDCFEDLYSIKNLLHCCRGFKRFRYQVWLFLEYPESSFTAKCWAMLLLVFMICSVMCFCLSTHIAFRITVLGPQFSASSVSSSNIFSSISFNISDNSTSPSSKSVFMNGNICSLHQLTSNPKFRKDCTSEPMRTLVITDICLNLVFTAEFCLKTALAPDKRKFLSQLVSIFDIVILASYWVYISVFYYHNLTDPATTVNFGISSGGLNNNTNSTSIISGGNGGRGVPAVTSSSSTTSSVEKDTSTEILQDRLIRVITRNGVHLWIMNILSMSQVLRILRIFRISKISRGLQVLILTVKKSIPELVLLAFLLMNGMFLFSALIYMAEYQQDDTFPDIPHGFWWSIVTLTTVGYGDFYPKGGLGYLIGSAAAISGCIVTGLAIPIIGNNFNTYYKYMQNQLKEDKYLRQLRKDMSTDSTSCNNSIYSNSPCPGVFRDQYGGNNQAKSRKLAALSNRHNVQRDDKVPINSSERMLTKKKAKKVLKESSKNQTSIAVPNTPIKCLPKLKIPLPKRTRSNPFNYSVGRLTTPSKSIISNTDVSSNAGTDTSSLFLTPNHCIQKRSSSERLHCTSSSNQLVRIEMENLPIQNNIDAEVVLNKHFLNTTSTNELVADVNKPTSLTNVTDKEKIIESPAISAYRNSLVFINNTNNKPGDYV